MILISFGLGYFLLAVVLMFLGSAMLKLVKGGFSIILILLPIIFVMTAIGLVLSIFGIAFDYLVFTMALVVYFYKRHKIDKKARKSEYGRISKIFIRAEIVIFHLLGLFLMPVPPVSFGVLFINLLLFAFLIMIDRKEKMAKN